MKNLFTIAVLLVCTLSLTGQNNYDDFTDSTEIAWQYSEDAHVVVNEMIYKDTANVVDLYDLAHKNYASAMVYYVRNAKSFALTFYDWNVLNLAGGRTFSMNNFEAEFKCEISNIYKTGEGYAFETIEGRVNKRGKYQDDAKGIGFWISNGGNVIIRYLPRFGKDETQYAVVFFADPEIEKYTHLALVY